MDIYRPLDLIHIQVVHYFKDLFLDYQKFSIRIQGIKNIYVHLHVQVLIFQMNLNEYSKTCL